LRAGFSDEGDVRPDHLCKHYMTDPVCAFSRQVSASKHTGYRPCVASLTGAFLYRLVQRFLTDLTDKPLVSDLLSYLTRHCLLAQPDINDRIW